MLYVETWLSNEKENEYEFNNFRGNSLGKRQRLNSIVDLKRQRKKLEFNDFHDKSIE